MRKLKKQMLFAGICILLAGCGQVADENKNDDDAIHTNAEETETFAEEETERIEDTEQSAQENTVTERGNVIDEQSFNVTLAPLGEVRFISYAPASENADATFVIEKSGMELWELEGMKEDNLRTGETFQAVEAVSFPDNNGDGNDDIIIICSYKKADSGEVFSEARLYDGDASGSFTLDKQGSEDANSALAEITVDSVKGFIGSFDIKKDNNNTTSDTSGWQQAYIDHINSHDDSEGQGYDLIYVDDDTIPELVEIGNCEAAGCRIVAFANGAVHENQLSRLYFTYIEGANLLCNSGGLMDCYYDYIYRIQDGVLVPVATGDYGAADNANLQFDESGAPIYEYYWNGEKVSKEAYELELSLVYNSNQAQEGYEWDNYLSKEEVIEVLQGI